jgi:hypothetical protein
MAIAAAATSELPAKGCTGRGISITHHRQYPCAFRQHKAVSVEAVGARSLLWLFVAA